MILFLLIILNIMIILNLIVFFEIKIVLYLFVILTIIEIIFYISFILPKNKNIKKNKEAAKFIKLSSLSIYENYKKTDFVKMPLSMLDINVSKRIENLSSVETKVNQLDAYFSYLPFTILKKSLCVDIPKLNRINLMKALNVYQRLFYNSDLFRENTHNIKDFFLQCYSIILLLNLINLMLAKFIINNLTSFYILLTLILDLSIIIFSLFFIYESYYLNRKENKKIILYKFIGYTILLSFIETPYNAFLLSNAFFNVKDNSDYKNLLESYQKKEINQTIMFIEKNNYYGIEEGLLFIYKLFIKNDLKTSDYDEMYKVLNLLNIDINDYKKINERYKGIILIISMVYLIFLASYVIKNYGVKI